MQLPYCLFSSKFLEKGGQANKCLANRIITFAINVVGKNITDQSSERAKKFIFTDWSYSCFLNSAGGVGEDYLVRKFRVASEAPRWLRRQLRSWPP